MVFHGNADTIPDYRHINFDKNPITFNEIIKTYVKWVMTLKLLADCSKTSYGDSRYACIAPTLVPEPPAVERLLQRLVAETQVRQPVPVVATVSAGLETLLRTFGESGASAATSTRLEYGSVFLLW